MMRRFYFGLNFYMGMDGISFHSCQCSGIGITMSAKASLDCLYVETLSLI